MKISVFLLVLNLLSISIQSQDLNRVDKIIRSYKDPASIEELSQRINFDFKSPIEKARAAFSWVAMNINYYKYDANLIKIPAKIQYYTKVDLERQRKKNQEKKALQAFNKREGVCEEFAFLLKKLYDYLEFENELVFGYTKSSVNDIGYIPVKKNHVWNVLRIENRWIMCDVTFASGEGSLGIWRKKFNPLYFNSNKDFIRITHFPEKKKWRDYLEQKELKEFCDDPIIQKAFLDSKAEIICPSNGRLLVNKNKKVLFKIKGINKKQTLSYRYKGESKSRIAKTIDVNGIIEFYVKVPRKDTILSIYLENNLALQYKIETPF
ncbi:transglutaminase domain-containing protein [Tenacibaculum sp. M341]|uniref:transglutaminase domain-containing protein n=1 Tax=Tenacibaculum sp. M341 TaxID=2530339 RepID=UPI0010457178|nr:transglutaminase domain-containing protein [Tenacibaculum sp. M341]TCI85292.1 hypothetical protein EYW44_17105 [Tenacibaculum sp. M341]